MPRDTPISKPQSPDLDVGTRNADPSAREQLERVLTSVRRRIFLERLVRSLGVDLLVFSCGLVLALLAVRLFSLAISPWLVLATFAAASVGFTLLRTVLFARPGPADAARALDERLELRERIASAMYLRERGSQGAPDPVANRWEQLVAADGLRAVDPHRVAACFRPRLPRALAWTLVPAIAAVLIWLFLPGLDLLGIELEREAEAALKRDVEEKRTELEKRLDELFAEARTRELPDVEKLLAELKKDAPERKPEDALSPSDSASSAVEAKKEELVALSRREEAIERALSAEKFLEAREALEKLASSRLKDSELTRSMRSALKEGAPREAREELAKLGERIDALAKKDPAKLSDEERAELQKLSEELANLARSLEGMKGLEKLAKALAGASGSLRPGDLSKSLEDLKLSAEELERLARTLDELDLLERSEDAVKDALEELAQLEKHKCPNCGKDRGKPESKPGGT